MGTGRDSRDGHWMGRDFEIGPEGRDLKFS